jgi:hypothetical protein
MTMKTRPLILGGMEQVLREREIPYVSSRLLSEMQTFVRHDTNPSPRAQEGCNDDCVMAAALALEMYRRFGHHPERLKKSAQNKYQKVARNQNWEKWDAKRYPAFLPEERD